jgi:hypothetical protein
MARKLIVIFVSIILCAVAISLVVHYGFNRIFNFKLPISDKNTNSTEDNAVGELNEIIVSDNEKVDIQTKIEDAANPTEVKVGFEKLIAQINKDNVYKPLPKWTIITDKNDHQVPIDDLISGVGSSIPKDILDLVDKDYYEFASCVGENGEKSLGLIFKVKVVEEYRPDLFQNMKNYEKDWEQTLFRDTQALLFPEFDTAGLERLNPAVEFIDGKYRYADISLPGGGKSIISHTIVGDMFLISNSIDCIDKMSWAAEPSDGS